MIIKVQPILKEVWLHEIQINHWMNAAIIVLILRTRKLAQTIKAAKKEKHINGWNLSNKLNQNYVYVRNFPGPKVRSMTDYTKPCIREKKPGPHNTPCRNKRT